MKKIIFIGLLFLSVPFFGQKKVAQNVSELLSTQAVFKTISVLFETKNTDENTVNSIVKDATLAAINFQGVNQILTHKYETIELNIPYQNQNISLLLYKVNPLLEGFHVDSNEGKNIIYQKGAYYRGIIKTDPNSIATFNFFNGELNGIISSATYGNLVIGKLDKKGNQTDYIIYSDLNLNILNDFDCSTKEGEATRRTEKIRAVNSGDRCVSIYFEVDNDLFIQNESSISTTTNWMTSVFNNIQTLYSNDGITIGLKSIFIWSEQDPYEGIGTDSGAYLSAFNQNTPIFDGDLGQLVGIDPGGLGGVAVTIDGLCTELNYSYSDVNINFQTVPTYSWTIQVISHEFGHLLGSRHTHSCVWNGDNTSIDGCGTQAGYAEGNCPVGPIPSTVEKGTIMSYCHLISGVGIGLYNGLGPQPAELILENVNASTCLSLDCVSSCPNTVVGITPTNVSSNSIVVIWDDLGSSVAWEVSVSPFSSPSLFWNTVTTKSYTAIGLNPNTYYIIRIRPLCSEIEPTIREKIVATSAINFCASVSFTDTGGSSSNYTDMESWVRTMTPNNPGLKLRATFTSFNLENNYDYLYVYNGPDEFSAPLTLGGLTGSSNPGVFNSTAFDGSLTFKFVSDQFETAPGWNATISCTGTLGEVNNDFLDYSYFPNPTNGVITIRSKDLITAVAVYNLQGQLLFITKSNDLITNVDLSHFALGTYLFKLKINNREVNFKILKM